MLNKWKRPHPAGLRPATLPALRGGGVRNSLPSIDLPAHQRERLLIDFGGIPFLDGREIRLARLIAGAGAPAMRAQEVRGRRQCAGCALEIADAISEDVLRQELRLADLAMHRAALCRRKRTAVDQL